MKPMTDSDDNVVTEDPVQLVMTCICSDFEHSLDQAGDDYLPIENVETPIRYTNKRIKSFVILLNNGQRVKVTGELLK